MSVTYEDQLERNRQWKRANRETVRGYLQALLYKILTKAALD